MTGDQADEDLMTRRQVAFLFRVTSQAVVRLARRGRLTEVRNADGKPRYRRAEVEELFRSSFSGGEQSPSSASVLTPALALCIPFRLSGAKMRRMRRRNAE